MFKELLQGKPFGHPLHPALVHLPIGLFILTLLLDLGSLAQPGNGLVRGAFYTLIGGVATALLAAIPGLVDWSDIRQDHPAKKTATLHLALNLTVVGLNGVSLILRYGSLDAGATPAAPLALSLLAVVILSYSGYLGGTLVYTDGIAVGRHRRHTATPRQTVHLSAEQRAGRFVPVARADQLGEGETLRAEVDGTVMTIVKVDGRFYAFQEFCTHRFGPLSEGSLRDHEIMCPWHRSCFDVRTGQVTQGPAKTDLKTFEVAVANGQIQVKLLPAAPEPGRKDGYDQVRERVRLTQR
ncbi:MAG: Rieske 2Fe-2S domain-containing protein [Chloroflexi bacterium]|nr:Rieske 2Fe-2S domain-containing protein [Chloroflexota bacterium]MCI0576794.1 Rieske 2Fe-2S domain-containing protein [Chloroflexota bacterium]MCI0648371.1 Rieske 2Fe-2S domain-containing protein [Chloroflexota bacterium]MCI0731681.1 Rieske 2Fe-2S domain-containing protein [Chloroflexota bacterium]